MSEDASEAVRAILGKWGASLPGHPYADFAQKVKVLSVEERPSFVLRLMSIFDARGDAKPCLIPLKAGAPPPPVGDIWSVPSGLEDDFYRHETRLSVAQSNEAVSCPKCEGGGLLRCKGCAGTKRIGCPACTGKGKKNCPECKGLGKMACNSCRGKGMVLTSVSGSGRDHETACPDCHGTGGPPCPRCGDPNSECETCKNERFVPCETCAGKGGVPCAECEGAGKALRGKSYLVEYQPILEREAKFDPALPEGLMPKELPKEDLGVIVFDKTEAKIDPAMDGLSEPGLKEMVADLLKKGEAGKKKFSGEARIIKQRLSVDRVPSYFVVYEYSGKRYLCWATAVGSKVVASESPFSDFAGGLVEEAQKALSSGKGKQAEEILKRAAGLASWPWLKGFTSAGGEAAVPLPPAPKGFGTSVAVAGAATLLLAFANKSSHHLFWPCAALFAALLAIQNGAAFAAKKVKGVAARAIGPGLAVLITAAVFAAQPFKRLENKEFETALYQRFPAGLPDAFTPDDEAFITTLTALYEPRGIDVSPVRHAVVESNQRAASAAAAAKAEAEAKAEADRQAAASAAAKKREAAALANAIRFNKSGRSTKSAKKKKGR